MRQYHVIKATGIPAAGPFTAKEVVALFQESSDTSKMLVWWKDEADWKSLVSQIALIRKEAELIAAQARNAADEKPKPAPSLAKGVVRVSRGGQVVGEYQEADIPALIRAKVVLPTDNYIEEGMTASAPLSDLLVKLLTSAPVAPEPVIPPLPTRTQPAPVVVIRPTPKSGEIVCPNPNCGYVGKPKKIARGSMITGILLLLFWIIPGVIYFMFFSGYRFCCPRCQCQISNDN